MDIGKMRHKITIQEQVTTKDKYKQPIDTWIAVFSNVWSSIEPIKGREFFSGEQLNTEITHRIKIRYKSGILSKMRVKYGTRFFYITNIINPNELNAELQLMCKEVL